MWTHGHRAHGRASHCFTGLLVPVLRPYWWRAMPCLGLLPLGPSSYWGYASPPQKLLAFKAQKDNLLGGSGTKGYHHSASNA